MAAYPGKAYVLRHDPRTVATLAAPPRSRVLPWGDYRDAAVARDGPGYPRLEICTAEKQMERRTGCLQSNVEFLQKALAGLTRETQAKMAAAGRDLAAAREEIAALKAAVAKLNSELAQLKTKAKSSNKK